MLPRPLLTCAWLALALTTACARAPQPTTTPLPSGAASAAPSAAWPAPYGPDAAAADAEPLRAAWPFAAPVEVHSARGMVVTDNAVASNVGRDVLAGGGNAADAAVATAFALAVAYPTAGNIGGGGFALTRSGGELRALDFRETAPLAATRDMYLGKDGKLEPDARDGIRAAGVPGSVAGLWELHKKLGSKKKTWAELLAPAIALAENGFIVDEAFVDTLDGQGKRLQKHPVSSALFFPNGAPPALGSTFKNPELAAVLRRIEKGRQGFYEGPTAVAIAQQMKREGGLITLADLKKYQAKWRAPITFDYRGHHVASMPPPSSGGLTLAMIAHILQGYDLGKAGYQTPAHLHLLFEAMRRAYAARNARLGDPDFVKAPIDDLLSDKWASDQRASVAVDRATPSSDIPTASAPSGAGPHTTHFAVVDSAGDVVSMTTTINWWYGSGVTVRGGGFLLNNEMDDFASLPGAANGYGLVQGEANAIAPGKRMLSSMAPTIVTAPDGKVLLVAGAAGGPTIITAVFQELSAVVDFGHDVGAAVRAPRFHMQHLPDEVVYEKNGLAEPTRQALEQMGYTLKERAHVADAPAIGRAGEQWIGVAEPRRLGGLAAAP